MSKRKKATTLFYIVDVVLFILLLFIQYRLWDSLETTDQVDGLVICRLMLLPAFVVCIITTIAFQRITKEVEEENASLSNKVIELEEKIEKLERKMDRFN